MSQNHLTREKSLGLTPADVPLEALPTVELTTEDIQRALELAEKRNDSYKAIDGGLVFGNRDALTSHQIGLLGELAVAKLYGIDIDGSTYRRGDDGKDHSLFGVDIDVKATATEKVRCPDLLVRSDKPLRAELYIRAHVIDWDSSSARVRIIGCASQEKIKEQTPDDQLFDVPNYIVNPEEMSFLPMLQPTS
ncbi:hypothetical protein [Halorubrum pallidum]